MINNKPIIGISTNVKDIVEKPFSGQQRIYINRTYINSVIDAGGIPLLLPLISGSEMETLLSLVDGVLLSGGYDVDPTLYNEEPHALLGKTCRERDETELGIIAKASERKKPILGICRGLQLINVAFGGSLYQDLSLYSASCKSTHCQDLTTEPALHRIDMVPNSLLHHIFRTPFVMTNSFHHQAVKKLAPGFQAAAHSQDGVIEGIVKTDSQWIVGVQWHPEFISNNQSEMKSLFKAFINQAAISKEQRRLYE